MKGGVGVERKDKIQNDILSGMLYSAGPLHIDRRNRKAVTVFNNELPLGTKEFAVLDLMASQEGKSLTFEQLYRALRDMEDGIDNYESARLCVAFVVEQVKIAGEGFMWIEQSPETGYAFRTNWGRNLDSGGAGLG